MSSWKEYKLGEIADIQNGFAFKSKDFAGSGVPIIKIKNIVTPSVVLDETSYFNGIIDSNLKKFVVKKGDFLISMTGSTVNQMASAVGKMGKYPFEKVALLNQRVGKIYSKSNEVLDEFLYYLINRKEVQYNLAINASGSANQANISPDQIKNLKFNFPPLPTQKAISEILSSLDDKIELNTQINQNLEALAQAIFKQWFIDFEFPNENGEPYKSSGGEMVDSELGKIPKGWRTYFLKELVECFDSKRVPLSSMERNLRKGEFPYYGAASLMDYVDDYLFDGDYVLMGEDGSVTTTEGFPVLQFVSGKFWVNNHAHVLKGKAISTELIHCLLRKTNITHLVTGAVQPKLNQGNMNKIFMFLPSNLSFIEDIEELIQSIYSQIKENKFENNGLTKLRDTLLPKLISGELEINDINLN